MDLKGYMTALLDLLLPRRCVVCGRRLGMRERNLCIYCRADLPLTYNWQSDHNPMADKFNALIQRDVAGEDPSGAGPREPYAFAAALFFYKSGSRYREITRSLKYHGNLSLGREMGAQLGACLAGAPGAPGRPGARHLRDVDVVMPVPLHWTRRFSRGYNQAEVIAREVAAALGAPLDARALRRNRRTKTQTHVSVTDKGLNVRGAFSVRPGAGEYRHILLVDDVFTTGSTLNECRKALRAALGPSVRISIATLGFVGQ